MITRPPVPDRPAVPVRPAIPVRATRQPWYTREGTSVAARDVRATRMTLLRPGLRARPHPVTPDLVLYDYPVTATRYELAIMDGRNGHVLTEITRDSGAVQHYSNGNGAWSPDGQWIIFQSQIGVNSAITAGRDPGFGSLCDLYAYRMADGTITRLTTTAISGDGVTVAPWRFQPMFLSASSIIYTERYTDDPATDGTGRWRLRTVTWAVDGSNVPSLSADAVYLNPFVQGWGYYITPMGLFAVTHPTYPSLILVTGNLDETFVDGVAQGTQPTHQMKQYAVIGGGSPTKSAAIAPVGDTPEARDGAWEEGASINPKTGEIVACSNGTGVLLTGSFMAEGATTTRELQIKAADGQSYLEITGFNIAGNDEYCNGWPVRANVQHSAITLDGRTLYAGIVVEGEGGSITNYGVVRVDLV